METPNVPVIPGNDQSPVPAPVPPAPHDKSMKMSIIIGGGLLLIGIFSYFMSGGGTFKGQIKLTTNDASKLTEANITELGKCIDFNVSQNYDLDSQKKTAVELKLIKDKCGPNGLQVSINNAVGKIFHSSISVSANSEGKNYIFVYKPSASSGDAIFDFGDGTDVKTLSLTEPSDDHSIEDNGELVIKHAYSKDGPYTVAVKEAVAGMKDKDDKQLYLTATKAITVIAVELAVDFVPNIEVSDPNGTNSVNVKDKSNQKGEYHGIIDCDNGKGTISVSNDEIKSAMSKICKYDKNGTFNISYSALDANNSPLGSAVKKVVITGVVGSTPTEEIGKDEVSFDINCSQFKDDALIKVKCEIKNLKAESGVTFSENDPSWQYIGANSMPTYDNLPNPHISYNTYDNAGTYSVYAIFHAEKNGYIGVTFEKTVEVVVPAASASAFLSADVFSAIQEGTPSAGYETINYGDGFMIIIDNNKPVVKDALNFLANGSRWDFDLPRVAPLITKDENGLSPDSPLTFKIECKQIKDTWDATCSVINLKVNKGDFSANQWMFDEPKKTNIEPTVDEKTKKISPITYRYQTAGSHHVTLELIATSTNPDGTPGFQSIPQSVDFNIVAPTEKTASSGGGNTYVTYVTNPSSPEQIAAVKILADKAAADKAAADKATADKAAAAAKALTDKAAADKAITDKAIADKAATDKATPPVSRFSKPQEIKAGAATEKEIKAKFPGLVLNPDAVKSFDDSTDPAALYLNKWLSEYFKEPVIRGYIEEGSVLFKGSKEVTRGEFVKMISVLAGLKESSGKGFFDDVKDEWFAKYINSAVAKGFIAEVGDNFYPNEKVKRIDALIITSKFANIKTAAKDCTKGNFEDVPKNDKNATLIHNAACSDLVVGQLVGGKYYFRGDEILDRSAAAAYLSNYLYVMTR